MSSNTNKGNLYQKYEKKYMKILKNLKKQNYKMFRSKLMKCVIVIRLDLQSRPTKDFILLYLKELIKSCKQRPGINQDY